MTYQVLARKWRPQTFSEVVGQEHIARTLKNAILHDRVGHAYLFVGSRGIGKTTSARIFAKALNCEHPVDGEPCCQCESCRAIAADASLDVIEIDAASHNGVNDIQMIQEQVAYGPAKGKYKIFIVDEVHMLSTAAWNKLLKTLEEPNNDRIKFLFATTEPHKVLPTIISRCQRFDLKRIPVPLIAHHLRRIADAEKLHVEDGALLAIARAADGGMRDAQSILDQCIAFCGGFTPEETIREADVLQILGFASGLELKEMARGILFHDLPHVLDVIASLADSGRNLEKVYGDLVGFFRNLMLAGCCQDAAKFLDATGDELADLTALARSVPPQLLRQALITLVSQEQLFRDCLNKRIALEVLAAQLISEIHSATLDDVLTHLNAISGLIPKEEITPRIPSALTEAPLPAPAPAAPAPVAAPVVPEESSPVAGEALDAQGAVACLAADPEPEGAPSPAGVSVACLGQGEAQEAAFSQSGFRRATKEEMAELKKEPVVKAAISALGMEPYDGVIPL